MIRLPSARFADTRSAWPGTPCPWPSPLWPTRDAIRLCREGLERFPQYVTARLILAKALLDDGDPDAALDEVRAILEASPHEAQAHRLAGELSRRSGAAAHA